MYKTNKKIVTTLSLIEKCNLPSNAHIQIMFYDKITTKNINLITFVTRYGNGTIIKVSHDYSEQEADNIICTIYYT